MNVFMQNLNEIKSLDETEKIIQNQMQSITSKKMSEKSDFIR